MKQPITSEVEKMTLEDDVNERLADARANAAAGDISGMNLYIDHAEDYAAEIGKDIVAQVIELETLGYTKRISLELASARENAEKGDLISIMSMNRSLSKAKRYAAWIREDIVSQVTELKTLGYTKGISIELTGARECAEEGDFLVMASYLKTAIDYAARVGKDITAELADITAIMKQ